MSTTEDRSCNGGRKTRILILLRRCALGTSFFLSPLFRSEIRARVLLNFDFAPAAMRSILRRTPPTTLTHRALRRLVTSRLQ